MEALPRLCPSQCLLTGRPDDSEVGAIVYALNLPSRSTESAAHASDEIREDLAQLEVAIPARN